MTFNFVPAIGLIKPREEKEETLSSFLANIGETYPELKDKNQPIIDPISSQSSLLEDGSYQVADTSAHIVPRTDAGQGFTFSDTSGDADVDSLASPDIEYMKSNIDPTNMFTIEETDARFASDLMNDNNYYIVERYMDDSFGINENTLDSEGNPIYTRKNVVDKYMNRMRGFFNGESYTTIDELVNLYHIANSGDQMTQQQIKKLENVGDAYTLYENMSNATFRGGATLGERADALKDFSGDMILDPINIPMFLTTTPIGGILAKIGTKLTSKQVSKLVHQTIAQKYLKKKGKAWLATKAGQVAMKRETAKEVERFAVNSVVDASKKKALKTAAVWGTYDMAIGVGTDAAFQKAQILAGRQPGGYDPLQGSIAGASSVLGFGIGYGITRHAQKRAAKRGDNVVEYELLPHQLLRGEKTKGLRKLDVDGNPIPIGPVKKVSGGSLPLTLHAIDSIPANRTKAVAEQNRLAIEKVNGPEFVEKITERLKDWKTRSDGWSKKVMDGTVKSFDAEGSNLMNDRAGVLFKGFLMGDANSGVRGLIKELDEMGIVVPENYRQEGYKHFTDWLTTTVKALPEPVKKEINEVWKSSVSSKIRGLEGTNLDDGMNVLAAQASEQGFALNTLKQAQDALRKAAGRTPKEKVLNAIKNEVGIDAEELGSRNAFLDYIKEKVPHPIRNAAGTMSRFQGNLIKSMVAHPGTTALNLSGWTTASGLNSVSDTFRAVLYGGAGLAARVGSKEMSQDMLTKSGLLFKLQAQKVRNFADPGGTQEATMNFLAANPEMKDRLFRFLSGGIETDTMIKGLDIDKAFLKEFNLTDELMDEILGQKPKTGLYDKYINLMQTVSGVKHQDMLSKTQEFIYQFDKQIRLNHKVTLTEFFQDDNLWKNVEGIGSNGRSYIEMQSKAVEDTLRTVFSKKYGDSSGDLVQRAANIVEEFHKVPVVGMFVPFGQFFNNTIAHMADHSGGSLLLKATSDAMEVFSQKSGKQNLSKKVFNSQQDYGDLMAKTSAGWALSIGLMYDEARNMEEDLPINADRGTDGQIRDFTYMFPLNFYRTMGRVFNYRVQGLEIPKEFKDTVLRQYGFENLTRELGKSQAQFWGGVIGMLEDDKEFGGENKKYPEGFLKSTLLELAGRFTSAGTRSADMVNMPLALLRGKDYVEYDRRNADVTNQSFLNGIRYVDQIFAAINDIAGGEPFAERKFKPLTRQNGRIPTNRLFGIRHFNKQTNIEKMFAKIGRPNWKGGLQSYLPSVNNRMNEVIYMYLEDEAKKVYNSPSWNKPNNKQENWVSMTNATITAAKKNALAYLEKNDSSDMDLKTAWLYRLTKSSGVPLSELDSYMQLEGYGNKRPEELSVEEIKKVIDAYKLNKDYLKNQAKEASEGR